MRPTQHIRLMELFDRALELPRLEQQALVERARRGDGLVGDELEALLLVDEQSGLFGPTKDHIEALPRRLMEMTVQEVGTFRLHSMIACGGAGVVWRARHSSGREVAVKLLPGKRAAAGFDSEVRAVAALEHPGIVSLFDFGSAVIHDDGQPWPYLAMALLGASPQPTTFEALNKHLCELLEALAHAHARGVIHRDVKPGNVLLDDDGHAVLTDFGIAWRVTTDNVPPPAGTPGFLAPEQLLGRRRDQGPAVDLYALGRLGWFWATSSLPSSGAKAVSRDALLAPFEPSFATPPGFEPWLRKLMALAPKDRPTSSAQALSELHRLTGSDRAWTAWRGVARSSHLAGEGLGLFGLRSHPVVGRDRECRLLSDALDDVCRANRPRIVVLRGQAGVGKTRLSRWLGESAVERGAARVLCATHSIAGGAHDGVVPMLRQGLNVSDRTEANAALVELPLPDEVRAQAAELIAPVSGIAIDDPAGVAASVLVALATLGPVVVRIEDGQWGRLTLEVLRGASCGGAPILGVVTVRNDLPPAASRVDELLKELNGREVSVAPLSADAHRVLIEETLGLAPLLASEIASRTEGNPLFAVQMVADLVERGQLEPSHGGFVLAQGACAELPKAIHDVWVARIAALLEHHPFEHRLALEIAALLGPTVDAAEWHQACAEADIAAPMELVVQMLRSGLATSIDPNERWHFAHVLLGESLTRLNREGERDVVAKIAVRRTLHALAKSALECGMFRQASALLERATPFSFGPPDASTVCARCTQAEIWSVDKGKTAVEEYRRALAEARLLENWELEVECALGVGWCLNKSGDIDEALQVFEEAKLALSAIDNLYWEGRVLNGFFGAHYYRGNQLEAARYGELALENYRARGENVAVPTGNLGLSYLRLGRLDEAKDLFHEAIRLAPETGNRRGESAWLVHMGELELVRGRVEAAVEYFEQGLVISKEAGNRRVESWATAGIAEALWRAGKPDEAKAAYNKVVNITRTLGDRSEHALALIQIAALEQFNGEDVDERLSSAHALLTQTGHRPSMAFLLCQRGHSSLGRGRSAELELEQAIQIRDDAGVLATSSLGQAVDQLRAAQAEFHCRGDQRLIHGRRIEDLTSAQRRWFQAHSLASGVLDQSPG